MKMWITYEGIGTHHTSILLLDLSPFFQANSLTTSFANSSTFVLI
jgi:hypothetical protein